MLKCRKSTCSNLHQEVNKGIVHYDNTGADSFVARNQKARAEEKEMETKATRGDVRASKS